MSLEDVSPIEIFISYSNKDKVLAGEIKTQLEVMGFNVFLAHEDIEPNTEWQIEIIKNLKKCDVFIPLISENFEESDWTDQETGIAFGLDKYIIPISIDVAPYGFIGKIQSLKCRTSPETCAKIWEILSKTSLLDRLKESLIIKFIDSAYFDDANDISDALKQLQPFNVKQVEMMVRGYIDNSQISGGFRAGPFVRELVNENKEKIDPKLLQEFLSKLITE